ncbi:unnamed protein product [Prorocentrum cordatum]|uniref:DNA-directed DNA polymerase n=1 Tax=Prorocentrum cordatum TaxID=2364126 RepID=A0ABN9XIZ9_9DINO|nr:unnamed protein product [Polarella glacialis]
MQSSAAADLVAGITHRYAFIDQQVNLGLSKEFVMRSQCTRLLAEIADVEGLTESTVGPVLQALAGGPWDVAQKIALAEAVDRATMKHASTDRKARTQQNMVGAHNYFVADEWAVIHDRKVSDEGKLECMARRLYKVGLTCPSPSTLKRLMAIVIVAGKGSSAYCDPKEKQRLMKYVQGELKNLDTSKVYKGPHIKNYPEMPSKLPAEVYSFAYGSDEPTTPSSTELDKAAIETMVCATGYKAPLEVSLEERWYLVGRYAEAAAFERKMADAAISGKSALAPKKGLVKKNGKSKEYADCSKNAFGSKVCGRAQTQAKKFTKSAEEIKWFSGQAYTLATRVYDTL